MSEVLPYTDDDVKQLVAHSERLLERCTCLDEMDSVPFDAMEVREALQDPTTDWYIAWDDFLKKYDNMLVQPAEMTEFYQKMSKFRSKLMNSVMDELDVRCYIYSIDIGLTVFGTIRKAALELIMVACSFAETAKKELVMMALAALTGGARNLEILYFAKEKSSNNALLQLYDAAWQYHDAVSVSKNPYFLSMARLACNVGVVGPHIYKHAEQSDNVMRNIMTGDAQVCFHTLASWLEPSSKATRMIVDHLLKETRGMGKIVVKEKPSMNFCAAVTSLVMDLITNGKITARHLYHKEDIVHSACLKEVSEENGFSVLEVSIRMPSMGRVTIELIHGDTSESDRNLSVTTQWGHTELATAIGNKVRCTQICGQIVLQEEKDRFIWFLRNKTSTSTHWSGDAHQSREVMVAIELAQASLDRGKMCDAHCCMMRVQDALESYSKLNPPIKQPELPAEPEYIPPNRSLRLILNGFRQPNFVSTIMRRSWSDWTLSKQPVQQPN